MDLLNNVLEFFVYLCNGASVVTTWLFTPIKNSMITMGIKAINDFLHVSIPTTPIFLLSFGGITTLILAFIFKLAKDIIKIV